MTTDSTPEARIVPGEASAVACPLCGREEHRLRAMLAICRDQFRSYEEQHRAKGTPEADEKADRNAQFAATIDRALAATPSAPPADDGWRQTDASVFAGTTFETREERSARQAPPADLEAIILKWERGENHNEGAFDPDCETCLILADLRALSARQIARGVGEDWIRQAAIYTLELLPSPEEKFERRDPDGIGHGHASWMLNEIVIGNVTARKAHRWLGYAQGLLVCLRAITLEDAKLANKRASDEATDLITRLSAGEVER